MDYQISTDKSRLDLQVIHDYLSNRSYWAKNRTIETVRKSVENSLCFGIYDNSENLLGFARIVTDFAVFASAWKTQSGDTKWNHICDVSDPNDNIINEHDLAVLTKYWLSGIE